MASWALTCKRCGEVFTYSEISETLANYFSPTKPEFPPEGLECECPNCKAKSTYQQNELTYQFKKKSGD
jgi:hypothetical protein